MLLCLDVACLVFKNWLLCMQGYYFSGKGLLFATAINALHAQIAT